MSLSRLHKAAQKEREERARKEQGAQGRAETPGSGDSWRNQTRTATDPGFSRLRQAAEKEREENPGRYKRSEPSAFAYRQPANKKEDKAPAQNAPQQVPAEDDDQNIFERALDRVKDSWDFAYSHVYGKKEEQETARPNAPQTAIDRAPLDALITRIDELTKRQSELIPLISGARRGGLTEERRKFEQEQAANREEIQRLKEELDKARPVYSNDTAAQKAETLTGLEKNVQELAHAFEAEQTEDSYNRYMAAYQQYSRAVDDYNAYMDYARSDASGWKIAGDTVMAGIGTIGRGIGATMDFLLPAELWDEKDPLSKFINAQAEEAQYLNDRWQESIYGRGKLVEGASTIGKATVEAIPNAILAMMSGGTSVAAQGTAALGTAATGTGIGAAIGTVAKDMVKNPMYWSSMAQTLGPTYEEAKENGANEWQASATALISSMLNAGVEVKGGIEVLPAKIKSGNRSAVLEWVLSTPEEGVEEVIQRFISGTTDKAIYDYDKPFYSATDPDAIVNPAEMGKEFALGTAVAGVLGGAQIGSISAANSMLNRVNNRKLGQIGGDYQVAAQELVDEGLTFAPETEAYQTAQEVKAKMEAGETVTDADLGRVVVANERTIRQEERNTASSEASQSVEGVQEKSDTQPTRKENAVQGVSAPDSDPLLEAAQEAVGAKSVPYNVMATENPERQARVAKTKSVADITGYGEHGTSAFTNIVETTGTDPGKVRMEFQSAYEAGRVGLSQQVARLDSGVRQEAYNAGRLDAIMAMNTAKEKAKGAVIRKDAGFDRAHLPSDVSEAQYKAVDALAKATGVRVRMAKGLKGNAEIAEDGTVLIDETFQREVAGEKRSIVFYAAHEIGMHRLMQLAPEEGQAFINAVIRDANTGLPYGTPTVTEQKRAKYAEQNVRLDIGKAMEEVAADSILSLYDNEQAFYEAIDRVINGTDDKAKQGAKKFKEILDDIVRKLKQAIAKLTGKEKVEAKQTLAEVEKLRDLFEKGLAAATERVKADSSDGKVTKNATQEGGEVQYALEEINGRIMPVIDTKNDTRDFVVAEKFLKALVDLENPFATILEDAQEVYVGPDLPGEYRSSEYTKSMNSALRKVKMQAATNLDEMLLIGTNGRWRENVKEKHMDDAKNGWYRYDTEFAVPIMKYKEFDHYNVYEAVLLIRNDADGKSYLYDLIDINEKEKVFNSAAHTSVFESRPSPDEMVAHPGKDVNTQHSLKVGVSYDAETESVNPALYSLKTWNESEYVKAREHAAEDLTKALNVSKQKALEYIDAVNGVAKMIADDKVRLDYESSPGRSSFVSNAEYGGSIDFSTICKKRRLFTGTFEAIQAALPNTALTAEDILEIRSMMDKKGHEVSCGLCYVEGSRANMGQYTKQFIERYKATNPAYVPNMAEMNTATGQEKIRREHPEVYEAYEYFMNHYGRLKPTDKALFASQQKPKMYQMATEYQGEILNKFRKRGNVEHKNANGGLRLQSFSDFEIIHLIDSMQVIMDMARVGLAGQAYTKVPDFAWALGDTGLKINLSLIAKGVDKKGNLIMDEKEGMSAADAMALRDRYSENVGTIIVVFTDRQLKAAMADSRIDYIIPFHRSQWKTGQYESMGLPANTKDYTPWQNESYIEPVYNASGKKQRPDNYMPNNYWDFSKSGKENAEAYLKMCAENNRRPKFHYLLVDNKDGSYSLQPDGSTDGYWKTLIDFKMYDNDGKGVPQRPVRPDFNMEQAKRMLNEYTGGHSKFPVAQDVVDEFVEKYKQEAPKGTQFSLVEDEATLDFLNDQEWVKVYRAMYQDETGLYPPMGAIQGGKKVAPVRFKTWYQADEHPELIKFEVPVRFLKGEMNNKGKPRTSSRVMTAEEIESNRDVLYGSHKATDVITLSSGNTLQFKDLLPKFELKKADGGTDVPAAYNPYFHTSLSALNDQFDTAYKRPGLVVVEGYIPKSELTSGYRAMYSKDPVGETTWKSGVVAKNLKGDKARKVFLSRWFRAERVVPDAEAAKMIAGVLKGEDLKVPWNVVTPKLREALEVEGVEIDYDRVYSGTSFEDFQRESGKQYSLKDSDGNTLTKEQAEFFKDSKVRDKYGNLKVMYHGSEGAGFHVFNPRFSDDGISLFFTDSNTTAKGYSGTHEIYAAKTFKTTKELNRFLAEIGQDDYEVVRKGDKFTLYYDMDEEIVSADTLGEIYDEFLDYSGLGRGSANYKVYLNLKNPLVVDARNNAWDELPDLDGNESKYEYIKIVSFDPLSDLVTIEYVMSGGSVPVTETVNLYKKFDDGIAARLENLAPGESVKNIPTKPTTTRDYSWHAKKNGYDGVIFNNIIDSGLYASGRERFAPTTVAIAFESNQIKSVDNLNPSDDPDIRFSLKEHNDLLKENAKLKEVNQELREQFKTTRFAKVDKKALRDFAKSLLKDYSSGADIDETRDALDGLYTYLANGEDGMPTSWNEAYKRAYEVAVSVLENATTLDDEMWRQYKDLRDRVRNVGISISPEYGSDLMGYEDLQDFRRRNFGRLNIVKNGTPVDSLYAELANAYPELFDEYNYTNQGDQLVHIAEVLEEMKPIEINPYRHDMREAATWLANDIMERFFELPQAKPTFADKAEQKLTKQAIKDAKKLERLREQKNQRIAEIIADNREKVKATQTKERTKREEAVKKVKEHYKAKESKASESRKARELRAKILRHTTELSKKLLRASDKNHIPQELQGAVAKLLECINMESNYTYDPETDGYKKSDEGLPTLRTRLFANLRKIYANLANELTIDPDLLGEDGLLTDVVELADKKMADMNLTELETIWKTIRAIEASVTSANIAFNKARWATISEAAEALRMDNFSKKEKLELDGPGGVLGKAQKLTGLDMMTPEAYFHRLGKSGDGLFRMMRDAQDDHIRKMKEVSDFTHEALKGVNVRKLENQMHTVKLGEKDVQMSTAQIMELYVLMRREQARDHIMVGGILPDVVSKGSIKKVSRAKPVRGVQPGELAKAFKLLTDEQTQIAEKLQEYASTELSKWGNEAAMKVYNYEKFGEKTYWPIRVNRQETQSNVQKDTRVTSVAGRGFTKGTKPHANNSVMVGSIFDTFSTHASEMATYAAWLSTMEDINRIRNFTFKSEGTTVDTVKGIIDTVHGKAGTAYLSKLLADLSNGVKGTHGETNYMSGLVGNYKAASVGANLRVIIQQPTSLLRALDMLDPQYLVTGMRPENGWKKALKYVPIAQWKDWGYFDINTGRQMKDVLFDSDSKLNKVKNASMWGASKADSLSWGLLWNAVETETKHKRKDLKPDTEEFYQAVAERFNEIVDHTQVVDGILQRSQIMRSADGLTKMATSFMGEPTKQYNMMMSAAYDAVHGNRKAGKRRFMRSAVALLIAGVVNAMAQSVIDAVRDDDKEKDYWEKWLEALTGISGDEETLGEAAKNATLEGNLGGTFNPAGYIPYVKDVLSIIQGYDVSRMDMESIEKALTASQNMVKALNGEGKYTLPSAAASLFAEVARMAGVPVANLKREVKSFAMLSAIETDNYLMQYRMEKAALSLNYSGNSGTFLNILFSAYQNDREAYEIIYKDMIASGYDPEKLANGMESRMKKAQGVEKAEELDQRYLTPVQQDSYDKSMAEVRDSGLWRMADAGQRDAVEEMLYNLAVDNSAGQKMQEKIDGGAKYGIDEEDYLLYKLALSIVDEPTESGKLGSYTQEEAAAAIEMLMLDDDASRYLWQSTNAGWKEKNNPWR